jgi:hypothetical protein
MFEPKGNAFNVVVAYSRDPNHIKLDFEAINLGRGGGGASDEGDRGGPAVEGEQWRGRRRKGVVEEEKQRSGARG